MRFLTFVIGRALGRPIVAMRCDSSSRNMGKSWVSTVIYDEWGSPYGRDHWGSKLLLRRDGKTADSSLYGTEWKHLEGPQVAFPETP